MLVIYKKNDNQVVSAWSGNYNTLDTIYPSNPDIKNVLGEIMIEDDQEVLDNPFDYKVENGEVKKKITI